MRHRAWCRERRSAELMQIAERVFGHDEGCAFATTLKLEAERHGERPAVIKEGHVHPIGRPFDNESNLTDLSGLMRLEINDVHSS